MFLELFTEFLRAGKVDFCSAARPKEEFEKAFDELEILSGFRVIGGENRSGETGDGVGGSHKSQMHRNRLAAGFNRFPESFIGQDRRTETIVKRWLDSWCNKFQT